MKFSSRELILNNIKIGQRWRHINCNIKIEIMSLPVGDDFLGKKFPKGIISGGWNLLSYPENWELLSGQDVPEELNV